MTAGRQLRKYVMENNVIVILVLILAYSLLFVDHFGKPNNLRDLLMQVSMYGIIAAGLSFVLMVGCIDLSVGYQVALATAVSVMVTNGTGSTAAGIASALLVGVLVGAVNGFLVTKWKIAPLIATIASMIAQKGVIMTMTDNVSVGCEVAGFKQVFRTRLFDLPLLSVVFVVFLILLVVFDLMLRKTRFGANVYVTGGNAEAGNLAGINTRRVTFAAYVLCGFCCALAGVFIASRGNTGTVSHAEGLDILAISACVIGGVRMQGGYGGMVKVFMGIIVMRAITNIMTLKALPTAWVTLVTGVVLLLVLFIDRLTGRRGGEDG